MFCPYPDFISISSKLVFGENLFNVSQGRRCFFWVWEGGQGAKRLILPPPPGGLEGIHFSQKVLLDLNLIFYMNFNELKKIEKTFFTKEKVVGRNSGLGTFFNFFFELPDIPVFMYLNLAEMNPIKLDGSTIDLV